MISLLPTQPLARQVHAALGRPLPGRAGQARMAPVPYRGKRCEPAYVRELSVAVAETKGCPLEELSRATCATAHRFFPKLR